MIALNYGVIELHPEKVANIKTFMNKYGMKYLSKIDDWKRFE